jgi:lipid-A-disaccharide synthase
VSRAVHVGHPYFDELAERPLNAGFLATQGERPGPMVAILPGSRTQELLRNLPDMVRAARLLARKRPEVRFAVACLHERHKALAERIIAESVACDEEEARTALPIEVYARRTPELIRLARVAWAVSGSVGLELMVEGLPSVVLYKVNRFDLWIARPFVKAKYISLVNLLADAEVFPEYLTSRDVSGEMVRWALAWLDDSPERDRAVEAIKALRDRVAQPGASGRAADHIVGWLKRHRRATPTMNSLAPVN